MNQQTAATSPRVQNPLRELERFGQSPWLDYIRKSLIDSGELQRMVERDGLKGVTSNPAIFEKAIAGSSDYAADLAAEGQNCAKDPKGVYERIAIRDVQRAADVLKPVYDRTQGADGFVSLEVSPKLAHDTQGTLEEARRLWKAVGRANLMIKVPGTAAGVPAIRQLIGEGIHVNVTLLFAVESYREVALAYQQGLETLAKNGGDVARVASVASFFVSRIDSAVDAELDALAKKAKTAAERDLALALRGKAAIANAKLAYVAYQELLAAPAWKALAKKGARPQRLLWASTSTKDPRYRDVIYVEELIGRDTVNTIPPQTWDAFRDHGRLRATLTDRVDEAARSMAMLAEVGVDFAAVTRKLLVDAVRLFDQPFEKLLAAVAAQVDAPSAQPAKLAASLPADVRKAVDALVDDWTRNDKVARLWKRDASLWSNGDEAKWLGWLDIAEQESKAIGELEKLAQDVQAAGYRHALLLGMGGSSLCPDVLKHTFGARPGFPELLVLDSTDPQQVRSFESRIDYRSTLFLVASKSGTTLEPNIFKQYFFERSKEVLGAEQAGKQWIAITDPGSQMQKVAEGDRFGRIFFGLPSIGGRYSALSKFGLVPAAVSGLDVARLLARASAMAKACGPTAAPERNPGVMLGAIVGACAKLGRDKLTIVASRSIQRLGAWLEQLVAESTGKNGKAVIPVDLEALAAPELYGKDRLFVHLFVRGDDDATQAKALRALEQAGHPVVRIELVDTHELTAEFFRWEIATAVAGAALGIHPFDQPDVEASKIATRKLTTAYDQTGALPAESAALEDRGIKLFTDARNAAELGKLAKSRSLVDWLRAHFARVEPGDYAPVLAYVEMNDANERVLQELRHAIRDARKIATCLGFGPRFLHSTGQAYKGGPGSAVVLQVTCDDARDLAVPGARYTFGVVKAAQARGDFDVLAERGRRALRVHLGADVAAGLATLRDAVRAALT